MLINFHYLVKVTFTDALDIAYIHPQLLRV